MFYNTGDKEYIKERHDSVPLGNGDEIISALKENERRCESIQDTLILCINSSSPLMASKDEHKIRKLPTLFLSYKRKENEVLTYLYLWKL